MLVDVEGSLDDEAWVLTDLAHQLFEIGTSEAPPEGEPEPGPGTPEERAAVREFLAGRLVAAPLELGPGLSGGRALQLVTVLLCRRHFPDGVMVDPLIPVCVRKGTRCVYPIPAAFWPDRILYAWRALGRRPRPTPSLPRKQLALAAGIALAACFLISLVYAEHLESERAEVRQRAAQAVQRARTKAKRDALLKTQTLQANLARLQSAALADRPALLARWRDEQGDAAGSRLAVFRLASTWPESKRVNEELLLSLTDVELQPLDPIELLDCLALKNLSLPLRRALIADLSERETLNPILAERLTTTPETADLERLECALSFGQGDPADLATLLQKRSPRWLESEEGRIFLERVAKRGPAILKEVAQSVDLRVRRGVAEALGGSQHPEAGALRDRLRDDADPEVRHAVRQR